MIPPPGAAYVKYKYRWRDAELPGKNWLSQTSMWAAGIYSSDGTVGVAYNAEGVNLQVNQASMAQVAYAAAQATIAGASNPCLWQITYTGASITVAGGIVYAWDGSETTVFGMGPTVISGDTWVYLNCTYSSGVGTFAISLSPLANSPYTATATWSVKIGKASFSGGAVYGILQSLSDCYDIRGRMIPAAIPSYNSSATQIMGHSAWISTVAGCA